MKVFVIATFVLALFGSLNALPRDVKTNPADKIKKIIDNLLEIIPEKMALTDIGFVIPHNPFIRGTLSIDEISLTGFKHPNIETITYDDGTSRIEYELNFKDVISIVDYTIVLDGLINIRHHFSAHIDWSNLDGKGYAVMSHDLKEIKDFSMLISLEKIKCDIIGLLNDDKLSKLISEAVTEFGAPMIDEILEETAPITSIIIKDFINFMLKIFSEQYSINL